VTPSDVKKLIPFLRKNRIQTFKSGTLEITFFESVPKVKRSLKSKPLTEELLNIAAQEQASIPPDLRADDTMSYDKILHWSGSPDPEESFAMPLTGEESL
jgi:hypothetical protein